MQTDYGGLQVNHTSNWLSAGGGTISAQGYDYWALITNIGRKAPTSTDFIYYKEGSNTWSNPGWLSLIQR